MGFLDNYEASRERLERWLAMYPTGRIETRIVEFSSEKGYILVEAKAYRKQADEQPAGIDYAHGYVGAYQPNMKRWFVEDTVTSAIMRVQQLVMGGAERSTKEIMEQVAVTTTSAISLQSLAQKTQLGSHNTAQDYVSLLEDCFALRTFYALDPSTGAYRYRKQKKFYFTDPLIYWIALKQARRTPPADWAAKMAETVAANWIWHRRSETNKIGYLATAKNGEIDFYTQGQWAIEVKWAPAATNLSAAYLKDTVPWKRVWTHSNFGLDWPPEL
jgi:hypothetical protein